MLRCLYGLSAVGIFSLLLASSARSEEEMVANPYYKFWAGFKPGDKAVHLEQTKLSSAEGKALPGGLDEKRIAYKLKLVEKDRVVVETVVTEKDFLGFVQAAPTQLIYPAKLKKTDLERILQSVSDKTGEDTIKVEGKDLKVKTVTGVVKGTDGEQIEFKLWLSDEVPGTIVKQVRTARQKGGEVVAETTINVKSYKKAD
jgi:hypothetical protein